MDGWMGGWMGGSKSQVKDCLQQSIKCQINKPKMLNLNKQHLRHNENHKNIIK